MTSPLEPSATGRGNLAFPKPGLGKSESAPGAGWLVDLGRTQTCRHAAVKTRQCLPAGSERKERRKSRGRKKRERVRGRERERKAKSKKKERENNSGKGEGPEFSELNGFPV